jgi:hypothetical protein
LNIGGRATRRASAGGLIDGRPPSGRLLGIGRLDIRVGTGDRSRGFDARPAGGSALLCRFLRIVTLRGILRLRNRYARHEGGSGGCNQNAFHDSLLHFNCQENAVFTINVPATSSPSFEFTVCFFARPYRMCWKSKTFNGKCDTIRRLPGAPQCRRQM